MKNAFAVIFLACALAVAFLRGADGAEFPEREFLSDAPDAASRPHAAFIDAPTYEEALRLWKTPEDVNDWIGARFVYDTDRAVSLAGSGDRGFKAPRILTPEEFYAKPEAVCTDLARFGVETVGRIVPELLPRYLRIEFEPVTLGGATLRVHWLALFKRDGRYYFFADSKRPGHMAGPYPAVAAFIADYEQYRKRTVVAFQERDSFRRKFRAKASSAAR